MFLGIKLFRLYWILKNYASDIDAKNNLVGYSPEILATETYKSERAQAVKSKVELEDSVGANYIRNL